MAFPTVAGTNTGAETAGTTDHTVNLPASIASGDLLVAALRNLGGETQTWPAGWTQLYVATNVEARFRRADGTEGASITVTTSGMTRSVHRTYRITGHHTTTDPEAGTVASGSSLSPDPPSLTPSWGAEDTLWFAVVDWHTFDTRTLTAFPANYTDTFDDQESGDGPGLGSCRRELNAASENPGTFTISGGGARDWQANTIAIRPAAAMDFPLDAQPGSYTLTGQVAGNDVALSATAGTYALTGTAATFALALPATAGAFTLTGAAAQFAIAMNAAAGALTWTGVAAELVHATGPGDFPLDAQPGSFALAGAAAGIALEAPAAAGAFALTGVAAQFAIALPATAGVVNWSGAATGLLAGYVLNAQPGSVAWSGAVAELVVPSFAVVLVSEVRVRARVTVTSAAARARVSVSNATARPRVTADDVDVRD